MAKSSVSDMTTKRPNEPFDPALDASIALTPDQLEQVVGGFMFGMFVVGALGMSRERTAGSYSTNLQFLASPHYHH